MIDPRPIAANVPAEGSGIATKLKPLGLKINSPRSVPAPLPGCNSYNSDTTVPFDTPLSIVGLKYPKLVPTVFVSSDDQLPGCEALMSAATELLVVGVAPYNDP